MLNLKIIKTRLCFTNSKSRHIDINVNFEIIFTIGVVKILVSLHCEGIICKVNYGKKYKRSSVFTYTSS